MQAAAAKRSSINETLDRVSARTALSVALLVGVFFLTRLLGTATAISHNARTDVEVQYRKWAVNILENDRFPYSEVHIEYPPASIGAALLPQLQDPSRKLYRALYVGLMLVVDVAGLVGMLLLARRHGSLLGPWLWTLAPAALGTIVYLRLDLLPAVATIWAIERASKDDWGSSGAFLGFGVAAKLYPLLLLPIALLTAPRAARKKLLIGFGAVVAIAFLPFVGVLGDVLREVVGYHTNRGIQIESLWGSILFIVRSGDYYRFVTQDFGAHHFYGGMAGLLKIAATIVTLGAIAAAIWVAARNRRTVQNFAADSFAIIAATLAVSSVLSPQFFVWVIAVGAAAVCWAQSGLRRHALVLIPIALITQLVFPHLHSELVRGETVAVIVLWCRNVFFVLTALFVLVHQAESTELQATETAAAA